MPAWMGEQYHSLWGEKRVLHPGPKLLLTQLPKLKYVVHYRLLKFFVANGMEVTRIHRAVRFHQSAFFEPYIAFNTQMRKEATSESTKNTFKLMSNALFGKTMENQRNRRKFGLVNTQEEHLKLCSRDNFVSSVVFTEDLVGVNLLNLQVRLNKPVFIGQAVLDLSKLEMYELRYEKLPQYEAQFSNGHIRVLGGDTDSFFLELTGDINRDNLCEIMARENLLDTSNYPRSHPLYDASHAAQLGMIKDENKGKKFTELAYLKPKCYSVEIEGGEAKKRAKGVQGDVVTNVLSHGNYKDAYEHSQKLYEEVRRIGSYRHCLWTLARKKLALICFDDKAGWVSANQSYPYGNYHLTDMLGPAAGKPYPPPKDAPPLPDSRFQIDDDAEQQPRSPLQHKTAPAKRRLLPKKRQRVTTSIAPSISSMSDTSSVFSPPPPHPKKRRSYFDGINPCFSGPPTPSIFDDIKTSSSPVSLRGLFARLPSP